MNFNKVFTTFAVSGMLAACGGGGGSSASASSSVDSAYAGSRTAAKVTAQNAGEFADAIFQATSANTDAAGYSASLRPAASGTDNHLLQAHQILSVLAMKKIQPERYQAKAISESEPCPGGGNVTTTGNSDDTTHVGNARMTFNQCNIDGALINGSIDVDVTAYNSTYSQPTAAKITYNSLTVKAEGESGTLTGIISLNTNPATKTATFTTQLHAKASTGEEALVDLTVNASENTDLSVSTNISGKTCVGSEGCVTVSTTKPVIFDTYGEPMTGSIILSGANNSKARIVVISYGVVQVNVDADGDGTYEEQQLLN